jgi:hypothetical protein
MTIMEWLIAIQIFGGNMDKNTERRHYLNTPFVARYIRVHPKTWHNHIALRAAILGCPSRLCPPNFFRLNELAPCGNQFTFPPDAFC